MKLVDFEGTLNLSLLALARFAVEPTLEWIVAIT